MAHDRLMTETFDSTTFATLARSRTALLTTFRRTGQAVTSPVSLAVKEGRAYFVTAADSGKAKRLAHTDRVELAPCTAAGKPLGGTVTGRAREITGGARPAFRGVMRPTGPLFWSWVLYRIRRHDMSLYEVVPVGDWPANSRNPGR
jgi:PPOX class probable F420-dependent enzyme